MTYPLREPNHTDFARARLNMVNGQLATNGIHHPDLVATYLQTPREAFVSDAMAPFVYMDEDIRIQGTNRWLMDPLVEARLLQLAMDGNFGSALVLGAASLPSVEMVAAFARNVVVVEPDKKLADVAAQRLLRQNITIIETSYREGYAKQAPYDIIFVTGALPAIPEGIATQLAVGGRLLTVLRETPKSCGRISVTHRLSEYTFDTICVADAQTPYLAGLEPEIGFSFS